MAHHRVPPNLVFNRLGVDELNHVLWYQDLSFLDVVCWSRTCRTAYAATDLRPLWWFRRELTRQLELRGDAAAAAASVATVFELMELRWFMAGGTFTAMLLREDHFCRGAPAMAESQFPDIVTGPNGELELVRVPPKKIPGMVRVEMERVGAPDIDLFRPAVLPGNEDPVAERNTFGAAARFKLNSRDRYVRDHGPLQPEANHGATTKVLLRELHERQAADDKATLFATSVAMQEKFGPYPDEDATLAAVDPRKVIGQTVVPLAAGVFVNVVPLPTSEGTDAGAEASAIDPVVVACVRRFDFAFLRNLCGFRVNPVTGKCEFVLRIENFAELRAKDAGVGWVEVYRERGALCDGHGLGRAQDRVAKYGGRGFTFAPACADAVIETAYRPHGSERVYRCLTCGDRATPCPKNT